MTHIKFIVEDAGLELFVELGHVGRHIAKVRAQLAVSAVFHRKAAPVLGLREFGGPRSPLLQDAN